MNNYPPNAFDGGGVLPWEGEESGTWDNFEQCCLECPQDVYLPDTGKWYSDDCLSVHFGLELRRIINRSFCGGRLTEEKFEDVVFIAKKDDEETFTGFNMVLPWRWERDVVSVTYREIIEERERHEKEVGLGGKHS